MQTPYRFVDIHNQPATLPTKLRLFVRSCSMASTKQGRPKPLDWSAPSHLTVFVRNLKLLHLDHREDWPDITLRSLSSSSANQRHRIRLVEWALYYLFTIWDPEGTQNVGDFSYRGSSKGGQFIANNCTETPSLFPTARTPPVGQPACSTIPCSGRAKEKWRPGARDNFPQDHAG